MTTCLDTTSSRSLDVRVLQVADKLTAYAALPILAPPERLVLLASELMGIAADIRAQMPEPRPMRIGGAVQTIYGDRPPDHHTLPCPVDHHTQASDIAADAVRQAQSATSFDASRDLIRAMSNATSEGELAGLWEASGGTRLGLDLAHRVLVLERLMTMQMRLSMGDGK